MSTTTITVARAIPNSVLFAIFVTALEGGIGYWARCDAYRWRQRDADGAPLEPAREDYDGFYANVTDCIDSETYRIDRATIAAGLAKLLGPVPCAAPRIVESAMQEIAGGAAHGGDGGYLDAEGADAIVQLGLFGRIVYG